MKLINATGALILAGALVSGVAVASEQEDEWYVAGLAVYIDPDSDRNLDNELAGGQVSVGKAFTEHLNFEIEGDYLEVDGDGGPGADLAGIAVNGMYLWNRDERFTPYLLGGIGAVNIDPNNSGSDTEFQAQAGPGFLLDLWNDRWALRAEALGRWADSDTDLLVNVGVQLAFGGKSEPAPVVAAAPLDTDGDGVTDDLDQCPGTPAGTPVDAVGCPILVDSDGDGVTDDIDECPDTISGALVDKVGCGYELSGVSYGFDSAELNPGGAEILDEVAVRLQENPDVAIVIEGYTDDRGAAEYNQALSQRRAESARDYLVEQGVAAERVSAVGRGEADPVASNDTEEGRAQNRRVVLKVEGRGPDSTTAP